MVPDYVNVVDTFTHRNSTPTAPRDYGLVHPLDETLIDKGKNSQREGKSLETVVTRKVDTSTSVVLSGPRPGQASPRVFGSTRGWKGDVPTIVERETPRS